MKMDRIPILNVYYLLCYAWDHVQEQNRARLDSLEIASTTQDLFGKVLSSGVNQLIRRGVDQAYVERREEVPGIRGKLATSETAKRMMRPRARTICDFEDLSVDILPNQILCESLHALLRVGVSTRQIRNEVHRAAARLECVSPIRIERSMFGQVQVGGNRRLYRFLLSVCRLLHDCVIVNKNTGITEFLDFRRDEATMWKLYEEFVTQFYRREQRTFEVSPHQRVNWSDASAEDSINRKRIPKMEADVILESTERRIILDTKFYSNTLARRSGDSPGKLHSGNLYQLLTYLRNRQAGRPKGPKHEGILLYPQVNEPLWADVRLEGFRIQARTIDLGQEWQAIHDEMLEAIGLSDANKIQLS